VQPAVYRVTHQRLVLSAIRLALAAAGFAASIGAGADPAAAGVGLALGAGICGLALVTDRRWLLLGQPEADPLPDRVRRASLARAVADGMLPSTVGVAVLAGVSLGFEPILTAVLAGILAGMGIVSLVSCVEVALWERRSHAQLLADADVHTRRYVTSSSVTRAS
jgi:hypothetical protein